MSQYYYICQRHIGRPVRVHTRDGRVYEGMIARVTPTHVLLRPMGRRISGEKGAGLSYEAQTAEMRGDVPEREEVLFFCCWIPFFAIAALFLLPFAFWW